MASTGTVAAGLIASNGRARLGPQRRAHGGDERLLEAGIGLVRDAKRKEVEAKAQLNAEEMFRHVEELPGLPPEWVEASTLSDFNLRLTAEQADALREELYAVLVKYRTDPDAEPLAGSRQVAVQLQLFPREEER